MTAVSDLEELKAIGLSGAAIPGGEAFDALLSSGLAVAIMNTSGLCQFILVSVTPGLLPRKHHRDRPPPGARAAPCGSPGLDEPRSAGSEPILPVLASLLSLQIPVI